jgi:hypothetical protein
MKDWYPSVIKMGIYTFHLLIIKKKSKNQYWHIIAVSLTIWKSWRRGKKKSSILSLKSDNPLVLRFSFSEPKSMILWFWVFLFFQRIKISDYFDFEFFFFFEKPKSMNPLNLGFFLFNEPKSTIFPFWVLFLRKIKFNYSLK